MHLGKLKDLFLLAVVTEHAAGESEWLESLMGSSHFPYHKFLWKKKADLEKIFTSKFYEID